MTVSAETSTTSSYGCIRLRGLPFTASYHDIAQFLSGYSVIDVLISKSEGKPNGQAYVLLPEAECISCLQEKNNNYIGKRYIEIFAASVADMETARRMSGERTSTSVPQHNSEHQPSSIQLETELPLLMQSLLNIQNGQQRQAVVAAPIHSQQLQTLQASLNAMTQQRQHAHQQQKSSVQIIRLRGLPFAATEPEIEAFLGPIELPKGMRCIHVARHPDLRPTGEAYVQLSSEAEVLTALKKHKTMMGKRYIEVFPSCVAEMQQVVLQNHQNQQHLAVSAATPAPLVFTPAGIPGNQEVGYQHTAGAESWQHQAMPCSTQEHFILAAMQQRTAAAAAAACLQSQQLGLFSAPGELQIIPSFSQAQPQGCFMQQAQLSAGIAAVSAAATTAALRHANSANDMQYVPFYSGSNAITSHGFMAMAQQPQNQQAGIVHPSMSLPSLIGSNLGQFNAPYITQHHRSAFSNVLSGSGGRNSATAAGCDDSLLMLASGCNSSASTASAMISLAGTLNGSLLL